MKNIQYTTMTAQELIGKTLCGKINPDPIAQRPPVSQGSTKSEHIIQSLINGFGIGMITLRDIRTNDNMQKVYPGVEYLVIDGGHRIRAMRDFYIGKFALGKKVTFAESDIDFNTFNVPCALIDCDSVEATVIFRNINTTTPVNFIEMVMSNEVSDVCKQVRMRTKFYKEYNNDVHPVFAVGADKHGKLVADNWDMAPNHRRKWDEYVFISMLKAIGGGNVDAGQREIEQLAETGSVSKTALGIVDSFLSDVVLFKKERGRKLNTDIFAAFQMFWFGLYEKNKTFKITNHKRFATIFMGVYSSYTGNADTTYNDTTFNFKGETKLIKEFIRRGILNFSNSVEQKECFDIFYKEAQKYSDFSSSVQFRDEKRSISTEQREQYLALQGYTCAIDGLPLTLEDSVWGHDISWAEGGKTSDGAVIRKTHNDRMGQLTINQYKQVAV